jgi:hypothetical protein
MSQKKVATKGLTIKGDYCRTFLGLALKYMIIIIFFEISFSNDFFVKIQQIII